MHPFRIRTPGSPTESRVPAAIGGLGWLLLAAAVGWSFGLAPSPAAEGNDDTRGGLPIGSLVAFGGPVSAVPESDGWLLCDGRELSVASFRELHAVLGSTWGGSPNGSTFRLPDLRGRFVRGANLGAEGFGRDPEADRRMSSAPGGSVGDQVGTLQEESVGPHFHSLTGVAEAVAPGTAAEWIRFHGVKLPDPDAPLLTNPAAVQPGDGLETRPHNVAVNWIVRVR